MEKRPKKLLDQVREAIRRKHYSIRTEKAYVSWIKRYILFHHKRHPNEMGSTEACPEPVEGSRPFLPIWPLSSTWPPPPKIRPSAPCSSCTMRCSEKTWISPLIQSAPPVPQQW